MSKDPDKTSLKIPRRASIWLGLLLAMLLLIEIPLLVSHARHGYFKIDGWFAFYTVLGLLSCGLLAALSKAVGKLVRRDDSYYGDLSDKTQPEDLDERIR